MFSFQCHMTRVIRQQKWKINDIIKDKETYLANSCGSVLMLPCLITMNSHQMHTKTSFLYIVHLLVPFLNRKKHASTLIYPRDLCKKLISSEAGVCLLLLMGFFIKFDRFPLSVRLWHSKTRQS